MNKVNHLQILSKNNKNYKLSNERQIIVFLSENCSQCSRFTEDVLDHWKPEIPAAVTFDSGLPQGWTLEKPPELLPSSVLFINKKEVSRFAGYDGDRTRFWKWLGSFLLTPVQQHIAFEAGTERAWTGPHLNEKRSGIYADPLSGEPLFRSDSKFDSGSGWPSFSASLPGAVTLHEDYSHGMVRTEVRSASTGIHLGHVFDDGPPPTYRRYCINGNVLKFIPD